ncbi:hypothetical protein D3C81_2143010 [compost metagenome]
MQEFEKLTSRSIRDCNVIAKWLTWSGGDARLDGRVEEEFADFLNDHGKRDDAVVALALNDANRTAILKQDDIAPLIGPVI